MLGPREPKKMAKTVGDAKKGAKPVNKQPKAKAEGKRKAAIQYKKQKTLNDFHDPASVFSFLFWFMGTLYSQLSCAYRFSIFQ